MLSNYRLKSVKQTFRQDEPKESRDKVCKSITSALVKRVT